MRGWRGAAVVVGLALVVAFPAGAAKKKAKRKPRPARVVKPIYGPPVPTPAPLLRAAGSCLGWEPDQFILVAEVGQQGRMFRVVPETVLKVEPVRGARVRVLYEETPDGPVAREILPGPTAEEGP